MFRFGCPFKLYPSCVRRVHASFPETRDFPSQIPQSTGPAEGPPGARCPARSTLKVKPSLAKIYFPAEGNARAIKHRKTRFSALEIVLSASSFVVFSNFSSRTVSRDVALTRLTICRRAPPGTSRQLSAFPDRNEFLHKSCPLTFTTDTRYTVTLTRSVYW